MIKDRIIKFFNLGYKSGFEDGYKAALENKDKEEISDFEFEEVMRRMRHQQLHDTSVLGSRKYGENVHFPSDYSILGSRRYGKGALFENIKAEEFRKFKKSVLSKDTSSFDDEVDIIHKRQYEDDCSVASCCFDVVDTCDCGGDGCDCDCSGGCDCGDGGSCE